MHAMAVVLMGLAMVMALEMVILVVGLSCGVSASAVVSYYNHYPRKKAVSHKVRSNSKQPPPNQGMVMSGSLYSLSRLCCNGLYQHSEFLISVYVSYMLNLRFHLRI